MKKTFRIKITIDVWVIIFYTLYKLLWTDGATAKPEVTPSSITYIECRTLYNYCKLAERHLQGAQDTDGLNVLERGYCLGYLDGISSDKEGGSSRYGICIPDGPRGSVIDSKLLPAFLAWTSRHADAMNEPEDVCVLKALRKAFPCMSQ